MGHKVKHLSEDLDLARYICIEVELVWILITLLGSEFKLDAEFCAYA
jgi:hypothetical protein